MITLGVTGHRLLAQPEKLGASIDASIEYAEAALHGTSCISLSSLAEGADRLVAHRILGRPRGRLVAVLPMLAREYEDDFGSAQSRAEFRGLLQRAKKIIQLPPQPSRSRAYKAAGLYVLNHCDVLIAVWDGNPSQGASGTAEIVDEARRRKLPIAWVHAGNRKLGTREPTSLGAEQGKVTFENWPERA